ncbi:hypothetical protein LTR28_005967 [Elasticomyces elasticus]|nr:hypothetical protein LTR28_005967 [Elasticomyces elasticus]
MAELNGISSSEPIFRAPKRRKIFRRRFEDEPERDSIETSESSPKSPTKETQSPTANITQESIARLRKLRSSRRAGIVFSTSAQRHHRTASPDASATPATVRPVQTVEDMAGARFVAPTGQVGQVEDRHMTAYIDSRLATQHTPAAAEIPPSLPKSSAHSSVLRGERPTTKTQSETEGLSAGQGRLQEIDLGPDATLRNIARTAHAAQRLATGNASPLPPQEQSAKASARPRLGKDGKPRPPRRRQPLRSEDDVARDSLVEQVLRESRLDMYEATTAAAAGESAGARARGDGEQAADDALAEDFRRDFLAAMEERNVRRMPPPPGMTGGAKPPGGKAEAPKGPKLGGSRSQRAAMRALEEKGGKRKK